MACELKRTSNTNGEGAKVNWPCPLVKTKLDHHMFMAKSQREQKLPLTF